MTPEKVRRGESSVSVRVYTSSTMQNQSEMAYKEIKTLDFILFSKKKRDTPLHISNPRQCKLSIIRSLNHEEGDLKTKRTEDDKCESLALSTTSKHPAALNVYRSSSVTIDPNKYVLFDTNAQLYTLYLAARHVTTAILVRYTIIR